MLDPDTKPLKQWPALIYDRPSYEQLNLAGEDQTPENYVKRAMEYWKNQAGKYWNKIYAIRWYAEARMGAFEAEHVKNAKPADSYSPVKGYKTSDI